MSTKPQLDDFPEIQAAIYRVALSLDSFLMNGIPFGVIQQDVLDGFLQKTATTLLSHVTALEGQVPHAPTGSQPEGTAILGALRAACHQLIARVTGLRSFRTLPVEQLRSTLLQIPLLRGECVQRIQELEACFETPKPFYSSRPDHSTAAVNDFLANLERLFAEERAVATADAGK